MCSKYTFINTGKSGLVWEVIYLLPDIYIIISTLFILFSLGIIKPKIDFKSNIKSKEDKSEKKKKKKNLKMIRKKNFYLKQMIMNFLKNHIIVSNKKQ